MIESYQCKVCGSRSQPRRYTAREMMFGTRENFDYLECGDCGSLQIAQIPDDLARFYPKDYYSFGVPELRRGWLRDLLKRARGRYGMTGRGILGRLVGRAMGMAPYYQWLRPAALDVNDAILEVGCGSGYFLTCLAADGYRNLTGVDPYIPGDRTLDGGIRLLKLELAQMQGKFDCIIMQHTIEHVADPLSALKDLRRLLRPGKLAIITTPIAGTYAWRTYGVDWVQLDPPRHLVVFSPRGLEIIARAAGFEVARMDYIADEFMLFGSEQYQRDVPLKDPRSHGPSSAPRDLPRPDGRGGRARGLPGFVKREFEAYLRCGIPAHGFTRLRCANCAFEHLLPFSCCPHRSTIESAARRTWWSRAPAGDPLLILSGQKARR